LSVAIGQSNDGSPSWLQRIITDLLTRLHVPLDNLGFLLLIVIGAIVLKGVLMLLAMNYVGNEVAQVATGLRLKLVNTLLGVRWGYFARQPVGRFANAVSSEAARAGDAYFQAATLVSLACQTTIYLLLAMLVSWQLGTITLLIGAFITFSMRPLVRMARRAGRNQTRQTQALVARLTDTLTNIKPLKAMARHVHLGVLFAKDANEVRDALRRQVFSKQSMRGGQELLLWVFGALLLFLARVHWSMPPEELFVMGTLMFRTILVANRAQLAYQMAVVSESAFWSLHDTIAEAEAERETVSGTTVPELKSACAFDNVSFAYGETPVLNAVYLDIAAGAITTITGASGAGKTTIADLLLGLHHPDSGEIRVDGIALRELDITRWRELVGYVPQEVLLFHDTVFSNVTLGETELTRDDARVALEAAGAWDFVSQLPSGLDTIVGERGTLLSGGQRQRIAVARALIHKPVLLILDEATSALDPDTEAAICGNLDDLSKRTGLTILAISHQSAWVESAARIFHLSHARVREVSKESLLGAAS
ncbi:MAG: ABC transporter ATP-binding protein, partial [Dongiaceae bacterium]